MSGRRRFLVLGGLMLLAPAFAAIDANTASQAQLESVAGIGPAIAARIVEERRKGPFGNPQDLAERVRGVGDASVRRMVAGGLVVGAPAPAPSGTSEGQCAERRPEIIAGYPAVEQVAARGRTSGRSSAGRAVAGDPDVAGARRPAVTAGRKPR